jgi:glycosyltransferase involved in cell wall biosynthesis
MPPAPSGVADYSAALLAELRKHCEVVLEADGADVHLYHLGNNQLHAAIYRRATTHPGVIVLHDAVLHHFALGYFSREQYIEEFVYNYGEWGRDLAAELWSARARSAADRRYFEYPMLRRVVENSKAIIVHNPAAARMVKQHAPAAVVHEIPHLAFAPYTPAAADVLAIRQRFGVAPHELLCGVFGHLRESKRISTVARACEQAGLALLLAGDCGPDLEKALAPYLARVHRIGPTPEPEFWTLAHAVDICINLRYPAAGETSGIAIRMMSIGKPVVLTDSLEVSRFPADACIRIPSGLHEQPALEETLLWLKQAPFDAREIGARACRHVQAEHSVDRVARSYREALEAALH